MLKNGTLLSSRYTIESVLGQGGMGAVYLATMEALGGKKVAVKEMELKGFSADELAQAVQQFKKEASFLANLEHPNLVQVTDFFVEGEKHYLVMAYVTGETLQQKLKRHGRPFNWSQVMPYAEPLVDVLHYLHTQDPPILFRDLKPSNIMIEDSGRLRLIDFGIARTAQAGDRTSTFLQGTGTSGFSPIEQYGGAQSTDQRSDIYSLGATLYYLLTGKLPPDAVARISQGKELIPASKIHPGLPPGIDELLHKALAVRQQDRHATMADFKRDMLSIQADGIDNEGATEDFGELPKVGESTKTPPPTNPANQESKPAAIKIEMFPTVAQKSESHSYTPWLIGAGSLAVASLAIMAMVMNYMPQDPSSQPSPKPDNITQAAQTDSVVPPPPTEKRQVIDLAEPKRKAKEPETTQKTPVRPRPSYIKPLEKPLSESVKPQQKPKPTKTRTAATKPRPSLGGNKYPTTSSKNYPTAKPKTEEKPVERQPVSQPVRQPVVSTSQPVAEKPSQPQIEYYPAPPPGVELRKGPDGRPLPPHMQPRPPGPGGPRGPGGPALEPGGRPRGY